MNTTVKTGQESVRSKCAKSKSNPLGYTLKDIYHMDDREIRLTFSKDHSRMMTGFDMPVLVRQPVDPFLELHFPFELLVAAGVEQYVVEDYLGKTWYPLDMLVLAGILSEVEAEEARAAEELEVVLIAEPICVPESPAIRYSKVAVSYLKKWYRSCVAGTRYLKSYLVQAKGFARKKLKCLYKERE